ncbi:MAG: DUF2062 domain-containing protein [Candidatus Omnitrophica bacterium]|nr:DUF2062 domain-containing protein [Candidatus Omnitrophota bacterium]
MLSFLNVPAKIIGILEANITPREIAFGVCLGMFLGFTPLNGTTALLLALFFFIFKVNRMATLLTLPAFKGLYLLGVSKLADAFGVYLLEKANYLTGFWRAVTNCPVIAYLDINRTTVAGGLFLSAALSVPVYFIVKSISAPLLAKYSKKIKDSAFSKWVQRFKLVSQAGNIIGPDVSATLGNVKATLKQTVISKVKSAVIKPKPPREKTGIMKRLNVSGIAVIIAVLIVVQVGVGLIISPIVSAFIIDSLNRSGSAKITVERINVWPLTLSFSMKELKVFDPQAPDKRVIRVGSASVHVSPLALLSKRLVFSTINMKGAELDLEGAPDGTFNIQHLSSSKAEAQKAKGAPDLMALWRGAQEKRDLFGMVYGKIKSNFSKQGKEEAKASRKVARVTQDLPKGKLVSFKTPSEMYMFEIKDLNIDGRVNIVPHNAAPVELKSARIALKRVAFDPQSGARLDGMNIRGELFKNNVAAGRLEFLFSKGYTGAGQTAVVKAELDKVDLDAVRFIYEDSLPVRITKGRLTLSSKTKITGDAIDSRNSLVLTGQALEPKQGGAAVVGFIPIATVCEALNRVDPACLKFDITGTIEKPEFGGFQETLMSLIKPYITNIGEQVKTQSIQQAVNSLKSLLGDKK